MSESTRDTLERARREFAPPTDFMARLARRREVKRRNQRIAAVVVGLIIALLAVGGLVRTLGRAPAPVPRSPSITSANVSRMKEQWSFGGSPISAPTVADGMVFTAPGDSTGRRSGTLYAFQEGCEPVDGACSPVWKAHVDGWMTRPVVMDGLVFTADAADHGSGDTLYAFDEHCGSESASCSPVWTARGAVSLESTIPVAGNGVVYVGTRSGLNAFSTSCATGGATCHPAWSAPTSSPVLSVTMGEDVVYVGTYAGDLYAFHPACADTVCGPIWSRRLDGPVLSLSVYGDHLNVGTASGAEGSGPGLEVFSVDACRRAKGGCDPKWIADRPGSVSWTGEAGGRLYVQESYGTDLTSYPVDCRSDGGGCARGWTAYTPEGIRPTIVGDVILVDEQASDGHVLRIDAFPTSCDVSCEAIWSGQAGTGTTGGIASSGDRVFTTSQDGLIAFGFPSQGEPETTRRPSGVGTALFYAGSLLLMSLVLIVRSARRQRVSILSTSRSRDHAHDS